MPAPFQGLFVQLQELMNRAGARTVSADSRRDRLRTHRCYAPVRNCSNLVITIGPFLAAPGLAGIRYTRRAGRWCLPNRILLRLLCNLLRPGCVLS
jgi:hypothetical protein